MPYEVTESDFQVEKIGEARIPSPMIGERFVEDEDRILYTTSSRAIQSLLAEGRTLPTFEKAGPRSQIYFDPSKLRCGIVTCGGLCPGINDVIRAIVLSLYHSYGVRTIWGFRYGFEGLASSYGHEVMQLDPEAVKDIHQKGGTILSSSRGPQDLEDMVDTLERMNIGILFAIGGDGTLRGARAIAEEIRKRNLKIAVVGVPKTIDNDIAYMDLSFGFVTAVSEATRVIYAAHSEATGARNGLGLVKLMGRHSGFIAAISALANNDVNFCLIPEVRFSLPVFLEALQQRIETRGHAVVVVAEGAGQELLEEGGGTDASGNLRLGDIGVFLKDRIKAHFQQNDLDLVLKYIDPSYSIRSLPSDTYDSAICLVLGHNAVHAAMSGRTNMVVGFWKNHFTHIPISLAVSRRKQIHPDSRLWRNVMACIGQPALIQ
ncbi:MAG TPA: ATP-dependent 6-phosphofructokinase [Desulfobacterales bacterium]